MGGRWRVEGGSRGCVKACLIAQVLHKTGKDEKCSKAPSGIGWLKVSGSETRGTDLRPVEHTTVPTSGQWGLDTG